MGFVEEIDTAGLLDSMRDVYFKQSLFYRNLRACAEADLGPSATAVILEALGEYGKWRAEVNRTQTQVVVDGQWPASWLRHWECADLMMFETDEKFALEGTGDTFAIHLPQPPQAEYFRSKGQLPWLYDFWRWTTAGISDGFDGLDVVTTEQGEDGWTFRVRGSGVGDAFTAERSPLATLEDKTRAVELIRQSSVHNGALYFFIARALIREFDATGEVCVRRAVREVGVERGTILRERHLAAGKPLNMRSLMEDWDGPLVSVWQWRNQGSLTELEWKQDCTWCPYAAAWTQFGAEGLQIGYLYDVELHTTMYNTYLPGITVRWDGLKTRGDVICGFRITTTQEAIDKSAAAR